MTLHGISDFHSELNGNFCPNFIILTSFHGERAIFSNIAHIIMVLFVISKQISVRGGGGECHCDWTKIRWG